MLCVGDDDTNTELASWMTAKGISDVYLGASDAGSEGTWEWMPGCSSTYTHWTDGEPNNYEEQEDFIVMNEGGGWNDCGDSCSATCVCEVDVGESERR